MRRKKLGPPAWSMQEGFRRLFKKSQKMKSTETGIEAVPANRSNNQLVISRTARSKNQPKRSNDGMKNEMGRPTIPIINQLKTCIKRRSPLETKRAAKSVQISFDSLMVKSKSHDEDHNLSRLDESDKANENRTKSDKLVTPGISYSNFQDNLSNLFIKSGSEELILSDILTKLNVELDAVDGHLKTLEAQNRIMIAVDDGTKKVFLI